MASRSKKPDARALFKQARGRKEEHGSSTSKVGPPPSSTKYKGMSKEQMLALLREKKAAAAAAAAGKEAIKPAVPNVRKAEGQPFRSPPIVTKVAPAPVHPPPRVVPQATGGGLTGLLGIAADESSEDEDQEEAGHREKGAGTATLSVASNASTRATSGAEGLPAGFFDEDFESTPGAAQGDEGTVRGGVVEAAAISRDFGPERAAQLVAEAEAEAEADARREIARLAALRSAGGTATAMGQREGASSRGGGREADVRATGYDKAEPSPNGSALPEGFFDDPEVDAKSRGVDLKAKKQEEEQNEWKDFMSFAAEIKKTEKEEEEEEEAVEEDKEQYEELEQATMMGRLAMLMSKSDRIGQKRKRPQEAATRSGAGRGVEDGDSALEDRRKGQEASVSGDARENERRENGGTTGDEAQPPRRLEDVELSVAKTGTAMREVAVASAPKDAAAAEIASILREQKRREEKELEEAFAGEYVPMDPLDWRARGR